MRGRLAVAQLAGLRPWQRGDEFFNVPIKPFALLRPQSAGGGGGGDDGADTARPAAAGAALARELEARWGDAAAVEALRNRWGGLPAAWRAFGSEG